MSADLEKLAQEYRERYGDEDIADVISVAARISRRRQRPEHLLQEEQQSVLKGSFEFRIDLDTLKLRIKQLEPELRVVYERYQENLLRVFREIAPANGQSTDINSFYRLRRGINDRFGRTAPDSLLLPYVTLPRRSHQWRSFFSDDMERYARLLSDGYGIHASVRARYNEYVYAYMHRGFSTLGELRDIDVSDSNSLSDKQHFMKKAFSKTGYPSYWD